MNVDAILYDFVIVDESGERLCTLESFEVAKHRIWPLPDITRRFDIVYQPVGHPIRAEKVIQYEGEDMTALYDLLDRFALSAQGIHSQLLPEGLMELRKFYGRLVETESLHLTI